MEQITDLASVVRVVKRRAVFFILPAIAIFVGGSAAVMLLPAIYRSQATILIESQQIPTDLVQSTVTALAAERLQVIQQKSGSRENVLALAKKFSLFPNRSDLSPTELADLVKKRIQIAPVDVANTGRRTREDRLIIAFTVAYEDESPQLAAGVANELVTTILSSDAAARVTQAAATSNFLADESKRLLQSLNQIELEISKFRLANSQLLPEKLAFNMAVNERLEKDIKDVDRELQAIDEQKRLLAFEVSIKSALSVNQDPATGKKSELASRIEALRADIATKSAIYSESHPEMKVLRKALAAMEAERDQQAGVIESSAGSGGMVNSSSASLETRLADAKMNALNARAEFLAARRQKYVASAEELKDVISRSPEIGAELMARERKRISIQKSLDEIGDKLAKARLGERLEEDQRSERFEVIEQPIVPTDPERPNRKKLLALVLAVAMASGGGLAYATEFLDSRIRTSAELLSRLGVRPIGVIEFIPLRHEQRRSWWLWTLALLVLVVAMIGSILAFDYYFMPLETLYEKVMKRIGP